MSPRSASIIGLGALILEACCGTGVHSDFVSIQADGAFIPSYVWIGDTITVYAEAGTKPEEFCYHKLYDSYTSPVAFSYQTSDTAVATISSRGVLSGVTAGVTQISVTTAGITSPMLPVIVAPAIDRLRISFAPANPRVGDTVTVRVDALSALGDTVTGAQVQYPSLSDTLASWLPFSPPAAPGYTFSTPLLSRLVARHAGNLKVVVIAPHTSGRPLHFIADTVAAPIGN